MNDEDKKKIQEDEDNDPAAKMRIAIMEARRARKEEEEKKQIFTDKMGAGFRKWIKRKKEEEMKKGDPEDPKKTLKAALMEARRLKQLKNEEGAHKS